MSDLSGQSFGNVRLTGYSGQSGLTAVYRAIDTHFDLDVAVRVLQIENIPPTRLADVYRGFELETKALAALNHPNIIGLRDFELSSQPPYLVMEYLPGGSLKTLIADRGRIPWQEAVQFIIPLAKALAYAHSTGFLHGEIRPSAILRSAAGIPKLDCFRSTRLGSNSALELINAPEYTAPELVNSHSLQAGVDIYALGMVTYELITGKTPFQAETTLGVLFKQANEALPVPSQLVPGLPGELERVIIKALAKNPQARFDRMDEFAEALSQAARMPVPTSPVAGDRPVQKPASSVQLAQPIEKPEPSDQPAQSVEKPGSSFQSSPPVEKPVLSPTPAAPILPGQKPAASRAKAGTFRRPAGRARAFTAWYKNPTLWLVAGLALALLALVFFLNSTLLSAPQGCGPDGGAECTTPTPTAESLVPTPTPTAAQAVSPAMVMNPYAGLAPSGALARLGKGRMESFAFSVDGKTLAVASTQGIYIYSTEPLQLLTLLQPGSSISQVAFSSDGRSLVSSSKIDGEIIVWDATNGARLQTLENGYADIKSMALSPDGKSLAIGDYSEVSLWDLAGGIKRSVFTDPAGSFNNPRLAFSPDGVNLAIAFGNDIKIYDVGSRALNKTLSTASPGEDRPSYLHITSLAYAPDGHTLAGGLTDNTIILFDPESGSQRKILQGHGAPVTSLVYSPDGKSLASGSLDGSMIVWSPDRETAPRSIPVNFGAVLQVAFTPDGRRLASSTSAGMLILWDAESGKKLDSLAGYTSKINCLSLSADGSTLASGSDDGLIILWETASGTAQSIISLNGQGVKYLAFSPDGKILASALEVNLSGENIILWETSSGKKLGSLKAPNYMSAFALSKDGGRLAVSGFGDKQISLFDTASAKMLRTIDYQTDTIQHLAFSPDGKILASASGDGSILLWDSGSGVNTRTFNASRRVTGLAYSPDGTRLASAADSVGIIVWDPSSGKELYRLAGKTASITSLAYSPDGRVLATGSHNKIVTVWDASNGTKLLSLAGHADNVQSLVFSPDGSELLSGSWDGTIVIWKMANP